MGWWSERSPWAKAAAERRALEARRHRALDSIDLRTADRVVAILLGGAPVIDRSPTPHPTGVDAYTLAFLAEHGGKCQDEWAISWLAYAEAKGDADSLSVGWLHGLYWVVRRDDPAVYDASTTKASWPTIAHAFLDILLDDEEFLALAADAAWVPDPSLHTLPERRPTPEAMLYALAPGPRAGTGVLDAIMPSIGAALLYAAYLAVMRDAPWAALLGAVVGLAAIGFSLASLLDAMIHEPRALRLAPDRDGLAHPRTGVRVRWEDVRSVRLTWRALVVTFADGETARLPRSAFYAPRDTAAAIASRVGATGPGPYRRG